MLRAWLYIAKHSTEQIISALALRESMREFMDPFNGNAVSFCGVCGYPMIPVRPGKVQCGHCELDALYKAGQS